RCRSGRLPEDMVTFVEEPVELEIEKTVQELTFQTDVCVIGHFPCEMGVWNHRLTQRGRRIAIDDIGAEAVKAQELIFEQGRRTILQIVYLVITHLAPAGAQFQVIHEADVLLEEFFFRDTPAGGYGR